MEIVDGASDGCMPFGQQWVTMKGKMEIETTFSNEKIASNLNIAIGVTRANSNVSDADQDRDIFDWNPGRSEHISDF